LNSLITWALGQPRKPEIESACEGVWRIHTLSIGESTGYMGMSTTWLSYNLVKGNSASRREVLATFA
jgi:hypothetical protein